MTKYKKMFVEESREHLASAARALVALEKAPAEASLIHELFRNAHSVKGMAASLGYDPVCEFAHTLEDLLDLMRRGERAVDQRAIDILLRGVDLLDKMVADIEADRPLDDSSAAAAEVRSLVGSGAAAPAAAPAPFLASPAPAGAEPVERTAATPDPERVGPGAPPGAPRRMRVSFRISPDSVSPGARGFLAVRALEELGAVHALRPEIGVIKSGRYGRIVDCEIETARSAAEVAGTLSGLAEIQDARVRDAEAAEPAGEAPAAQADPALGANAAAHTVRVKTEILDRFMDAVGELILGKAELREIARELQSEPLNDVLSRMESNLEELKRQAMGVRLTPLDRVFGRLPRIVRDVARAGGKQARIEVRGGTLELDRAIVEALGDPLVHMVRNAVDHGIEKPGERAAAGKNPEGRILIEAYREKDVAVIHVEDDGAGVDPDGVRRAAVARGIATEAEVSGLDERGMIELLFRPGMSTAAGVSEVSGRGVGLDAVKSCVQGLGGSVVLESHRGAGSQITLRIPFSAAILQALLVKVGEEILAVPLARIQRALEVESAELVAGSGPGAHAWFCRCGDELLPARALGAALGYGPSGADGPPGNRTLGVLVTETRGGREAILVDAFAGQEEVFVKPLGRPISSLEALSGITVLGSGRPVLVVDPNALSAAARPARRAGPPEERTSA
jgi:two-component system chemotaxis sensor kinase CheA